MVGVMAYHLKWDCFQSSMVIINFVFVLLANGQSTIKESGNGEVYCILTDMHHLLLDEIRSLRNEMNSMNSELKMKEIQLKDRADEITQIVNASREEISKMKEETSKIREETTKITDHTSILKAETSQIKEKTSQMIRNAISQLSGEIESSRSSLVSNVTELLRPNGSNPVCCRSFQMEQLNHKIQAFDLILQKQKKLIEDPDGCQLSRIVNTSREETAKIREEASKIVTDAVYRLSAEINRSKNTLLSNVTELLCSNDSKAVGCRSFQTEQLNHKIQAFDLMLQKQKKLIEAVYCNVARPKDCADLRKCGFDTSGIYEVMLPDKRLLSVYCDMDSNGIGWLVFQRRMDGSVDFYRGWNDYANGFGNKSGEFWLGNDLLHLLTSNRKYKLRFDLEDFQGNKTFAEYGTFSVGSAADKYRLNVAGYSGNAGDSFANRHNGSQFSTKDSDNDRYPVSCAQTYKGAWWYNRCHYCNLNGLYLRGHHSSEGDGVNWAAFRGVNYSLKFTQMKISPSDIPN